MSYLSKIFPILGLTIVFFSLLNVFACSVGEEEVSIAEVEKGYVKGRVTDTQGRPLAGVEIVIDNTLVYNSNLKTTTNANGEYRVELPGSFTWMAYARLTRAFNGRTYTLDLHPETNEGFTSDGGVRNFSWKLSGKRPGGANTGYYSGLVTFDNFPGVYDVLDTEIEFTFTPVGLLIDGSTGQVLRLRSEDGYRLPGIPIGRYTVSATYNGAALGLRPWNTDGPFATNFLIDFEDQIPSQCDNCAMLEYNR